MAKFTDINMGNNHGQRRRYIFDGTELDIVNAAIPAPGLVTTQNLYAPAFVHFAGQLDLTLPVVTTVEILIQPIAEDSSLPIDDEFLIATITTAVPARTRYAFYWGEARGLLTGVLFGSTYCLSAAFRILLRNTGADAVTSASLIQLECVS